MVHTLFTLLSSSDYGDDKVLHIPLSSYHIEYSTMCGISENYIPVFHMSSAKNKFHKLLTLHELFIQYHEYM